MISELLLTRFLILGVAFCGRGYRKQEEECYTASGATVPKTTKATLASRLEKIHPDELSKTFRDALEITRGLGLRYIWIDSLCIIQDSPEDFQVECAQMGKVYLNAVCTIAATDSPTSTTGCLLPRDASTLSGSVVLSQKRYLVSSAQRNIMSPEFDRQYKSEPAASAVHVYQKYGPFLDAIRGPLTARGWTLQERELAPRILHFARDQVWFECRVCVASEVGREMEPKQGDGVDQDQAGGGVTPWEGVDYLAWCVRRLFKEDDGGPSDLAAA
ncbi:HET-domain-containing protein [Canariomyces notabilis]|uniref:HET-domain-containing protein n=1 Tax=Canariomyces notabilis TaxID=2074819 RepID=A0AAN6QEY5_9PEZI|nr:HET-domain-containing protein [Canariomyces arenarius]